MNHRFTLWCLTATMLLITASLTPAMPPRERPHDQTASQTISNDVYLDANNILMFVTNHGNFGRDLGSRFGYDYGTFFPFSSIADIENGANTLSPLYAGGLWLGGIDSASGDTLVTISEYSSEYAPGPMLYGTYQTDRPSYRVYKLYSDSLGDNPNSDYYALPLNEGAPMDCHQYPLMIGDQMTWAVYNDADPSRHTNNTGETEPLGVEVQQTIFSYDSDIGFLSNVVFFRFKAINRGNRTLNDFFLSLWLDPDLGDSGDDLVGCDTINDIFYCYNATNNDSKYGTRPPAIGFRLMEGPIVPSAGDTAKVDGLSRPGYKNLGMYSFVKYINGTDPDNYAQAYCFMHGFDAKNSCAPYSYDGKSTRFWHSGDPTSGSGDLDATPSDRRMMASCGPLTFRPGDTQQVIFAMAVGQFSNRLISLTGTRYILMQLATPTGLDCDPTGVDDPGGSDALPRTFVVQQNYPNPFNPSTVISYSLPERADVEVSIFNVLGQKITTLVRKSQPAGEYTTVWNGSDATGHPVASGIYFYRVQAGHNVQTRKMMLLK
jgi:hypothetical protein